MIVCVGLVHWILPRMHAIIERTNVAHKWDLKNYAINICCHFVCTCRPTCTLCKSSNMWYSCSENLRVESRLNGLRYVVFPMPKKFPQSLNLTLFLRWQLPLNSKLICLLYMNIWADYTWIFLLLQCIPAMHRSACVCTSPQCCSMMEPWPNHDCAKFTYCRSTWCVKSCILYI